MVVSHLRPAGDEARAEDLLPRSHRDPDELFGFVLHLADEVADPGLRRLLDALTGDDDLARAWRTMPCTRSGHHAYMGGLVEHTVGVASVAQTLTVWHPRLDSDLLLAAALVHDIGHARAFRLGATFELTDEGRLLGHVAIGHEIVGDAARAAGLTPVRRAELLHAIDWHHGPPAGQAAGRRERRGARAVAREPARDVGQVAPRGTRNGRYRRDEAGFAGAETPRWSGETAQGAGYGCGARRPMTLLTPPERTPTRGNSR